MKGKNHSRRGKEDMHGGALSESGGCRGCRRLEDLTRKDAGVLALTGGDRRWLERWEMPWRMRDGDVVKGAQGVLACCAGSLGCSSSVQVQA